METITYIVPTIGTWLTVNLSCGHRADNIHFNHKVGDSYECVKCAISRAMEVHGNGPDAPGS